MCEATTGTHSHTHQFSQSCHQAHADISVGRMVRYYFALAYKMVKMSKSAFSLKMEASQNENLS